MSVTGDKIKAIRKEALLSAYREVREILDARLKMWGSCADLDAWEKRNRENECEDIRTNVDELITRTQLS